MSYPGSKGQAGTFQRIIGQMPPHSVYVGPFAGSAQVFFRKRRADLSILIDRSPAVITAVNVNSDAPGRAVKLCGDSLEVLPDLFYPTFPAHRPFVSDIWQGLNLQALIYCDPPYLLSTRKGRRYYRHEMSDDDHAALLSTLVDLKCYVMISGYPSALYSSRLQNWRCVRYRTRTRGATVTECLWCNFPEPTVLHDWRYAGQSHRQRLTWRRLAARAVARLERMSDRQRGYVWHALQARQNERRDIVTPLLTGGAVKLSSNAGTDRAGAGVNSGVKRSYGSGRRRHELDHEISPER